MFDKSDRIKEERTSRALSRGIMGLAGKLACIANFLGSKIVSETADFHSENPMFDVWDMQSSDEYDHKRIHDGDETACSRDIGFIFDGLSRGMHLEIKYMFSDKSLSVYHNGIKVYLEIGGDLQMYAPTQEWESMIDRLFVVAKAKADVHKKEESAQSKVISNRNKLEFLDRLRLQWGI